MFRWAAIYCLLMISTSSHAQNFVPAAPKWKIVDFNGDLALTYWSDDELDARIEFHCKNRGLVEASFIDVTSLNAQAPVAATISTGSASRAISGRTMPALPGERRGFVGDIPNASSFFASMGAGGYLRIKLGRDVRSYPLRGIGALGATFASKCKTKLR